MPPEKEIKEIQAVVLLHSIEQEVNNILHLLNISGKERKHLKNINQIIILFLKQNRAQRIINSIQKYLLPKRNVFTGPINKRQNCIWNKKQTIKKSRFKFAN